MTDKELKIAIVGPGAMGCLLAAHLRHLGIDVWLIDYNEQRVNYLSRHPIVIEREGAQKALSVYVPIHLAGQSAPPPDWIVLFVKAYATKEAIDSIAHLINKETKLLSLQNGIGYDQLLSSVADQEQIALGITTQGALLKKWGEVVHAGVGPTFIGPASASPSSTMLEALDHLSKVMSDAAWQTSVTTSIHSKLWQKLFINIGINAITAMLCVSNGRLLDIPEAVKIQKMAIEEAWQIAKKAGIDTKITLSEAISLVRKICKETGHNHSSMLQDRLKNRPTEINVINGAIVKLARQIGAEAPVNETITLLIKSYEKTGWQTDCE